MRISSVFFAFACIMLLVQACSSTSRLDFSPYPNTGNNTRPASEKVIYQTMGHGLLGENFAIMHRQDQRKALAAEYRALEYGQSGQTISWIGESSGMVTAGQPYRVGLQNCRHYNHNFTIGTIPYTVSGSACRNEDGSWSPLL